MCGSSSRWLTTGVAPLPSIRLLLVFLLMGLASARFPIEKWECGNDDFWKSIVHGDIVESCPHFAAEINHCCVVHDECYGRQLGQERCDKEFDDCNQKVFEDDRAHPCKSTMDLAYTILKTMGNYAYGASVNYTGEPPEHELLHLCRPEKRHGVFFDYMYVSCPTIKKPISSCCEQLERCPDSPLGRNRTECANRAMGCLKEARLIEPAEFNEGKCDRALERTREYMALDYIMEDDIQSALAKRALQAEKGPELFANSHQAFVLLMFLSIACAFGLLFTTFKYYRLRSESKDTRKYSTITLSAA